MSTENRNRTQNPSTTETTSRMSLRVDRLMGATIRTSDDREIGSIHDFLFDDETWQTRYMVVDTGPWLFGRKVLISPYALDGPIVPGAAIDVRLTKQQVEDSPPIDVDEPVSRQQQGALHDFYGWPYYWAAVPGAVGYSGAGASMTAGAAVVAAPVEAEATAAVRDETEEELERAREAADPNLRSMREVIGYNISATDDQVGHVEDFFIDSESLKIRFLLIDTRNWLPGRHVLVSPDWIDRVSWHDARVYVEVTRDQIESSPEFDPQETVGQDTELLLFKHYGYPYVM